MMKRTNLFGAYFFAILISMTAFFGGQTAVQAADANELVIADFDTGDKPNNIGGDLGAWNKDPNDETQGCHMAFASDDAKGNASGFSLQLDYDVDSKNPAYNGFWMKLNSADLSAYKVLSFYIKGAAKNGFTKRVKLELKDISNKPSTYMIGGITDQWQKISIPFEKLRQISDWKHVNEFVLVFDDVNSKPKTGTIFVDHIVAAKE